MTYELAMPTSRDLPCYHYGASNDRRESARTVEMAQHFSQVMIETGFSPRDVALAFMQVGMLLSEELERSDGTDFAAGSGI